MILKISFWDNDYQLAFEEVGERVMEDILGGYAGDEGVKRAQELFDKISIRRIKSSFIRAVALEMEAGHLAQVGLLEFSERDATIPDLWKEITRTIRYLKGIQFELLSDLEEIPDTWENNEVLYMVFRAGKVVIM